MIQLRSFLCDERGTASIEFLFIFPIVFTIFTASLESSFYMIRSVMLERSVDIVVRQIRLGNMDGASHEYLKSSICKVGILAASVADCVQSMKIWMQPISTTNFAMVAPTSNCVDKTQPINATNPPGAEYAFGGDNDIMLLRICLKEKPMFPTTAISIQMPLQPDGYYAMITTSVFVNEPG